jgi:ABC-type nitrate/sulfonate/bicarbonate transport system substrate-binding protein
MQMKSKKISIKRITIKEFWRRIAYLIVLVLTPLIIFGCRDTSQVSPPASPPATVASPTSSQVEVMNVSMRLPIPVVDTAFSPYYLGIDKGIFAKYGLNVKLEPGTAELNPVKMLAQGTDQFAVLGGPEILFAARSKGAQITGTALVHKDANFVTLLTLKKSQITKLSELEGKKVGFFYGHISTDVLRMMFKKENVNVQETDVGFDYGQFIAGKLDAQWAFKTTAGVALPAKGVEINFINPSDYGIVTQGHVVVTSDKMIKEKPKIVQAFNNAVLEATTYSLENPQEAIAAAIKRDPNFKQVVGEKQLEIYNAAIKRNSRIGAISESDMQKTKEQMLLVGLIPKEFDVKSAYTSQFVEQYYKGKS